MPDISQLSTRNNHLQSAPSHICRAHYIYHIDNFDFNLQSNVLDFELCTLNSSVEPVNMFTMSCTLEVKELHCIALFIVRFQVGLDLNQNNRIEFSHFTCLRLHQACELSIVRLRDISGLHFAHKEANQGYDLNKSIWFRFIAKNTMQAQRKEQRSVKVQSAT